MQMEVGWAQHSFRLRIACRATRCTLHASSHRVCRINSTPSGDEETGQRAPKLMLFRL